MPKKGKASSTQKSDLPYPRFKLKKVENARNWLGQARTFITNNWDSYTEDSLLDCVTDTICIESLQSKLRSLTFTSLETGLLTNPGLGEFVMLWCDPELLRKNYTKWILAKQQARLSYSEEEDHEATDEADEAESEACDADSDEGDDWEQEDWMANEPEQYEDSDGDLDWWAQDHANNWYYWDEEEWDWMEGVDEESGDEDADEDEPEDDANVADFQRGSGEDETDSDTEDDSHEG